MNDTRIKGLCHFIDILTFDDFRGIGEHNNSQTKFAVLKAEGAIFMSKNDHGFATTSHYVRMKTKQKGNK